MIGKVSRGTRVGGLLRYLYGPGRANEHIDPHMVAAWEEPNALEPALSDAGRRDFRQLTALLEQPLAALTRSPAKPVWHCSLRTAPGDRPLTDAEWAEVAREAMHRTGLAQRGDDGGCRWVAVRHADDHIHLVVTLARQDGKPARTSNDFYRLGEAARWAEERFGLTRTAPRDRTAPKTATRAELEKSRRAGRRESPRVALRREVRAAAARAADPDEFFSQLTSAGVLIRRRLSPRDPTQVTGYAVALPGDRNRDHQPIWFGGGKLAADLTLPKLRARWGLPPRTPGARLSAAERDAAWEKAIRAATHGAVDVRRLAAKRPHAAADAAHATSDVLISAARVVEGRAGGPISDAADAYDRAARNLWARPARRSTTGDGLRAAARTLALAGRATNHETAQALRLLASLASLVEAVAQLREVQQRSAQAVAARQAAERLRAAAPSRRTAPARPRARALQHHPQTRRREVSSR